MVMVLALPKYAVFKNKANSKILTLRKDDKYLSFTGDSVLSPEAKFAIEPASSGNGQVHVRSASNNKYLVRNSSGFVIAGAIKPEEDATKDTCTLLAPLSVNDGDTSTIRFSHVQSGNYAKLNYSGSAANLYDACLYAVTSIPDSNLLWDALEVIDWETLVIFPSHDISFAVETYKGKKYLKADKVPSFALDDNTSLLASFRVEPVGDGSIRIYCNYLNKYLSSNGLFLGAENTDKSPNDPNELFWPVKLDSNVIALRCLGSNKFISVIIIYDINVFVVVGNDTITKDCHISVEELVISRSIHNVVYRYDDARVYNETPTVCGKGVATNDSHGEDTMQIPIIYKESNSTSWDNSVSLKVGASTTFETGVPFIAEGEIKIEASVTGGHKWGGINEVSTERGLTYTATIPPKTHVEINYVATRGTCDIPFSYTVVDTLLDGTHKRTFKEDGLYTGVNYYNFDFDKKETPV